MKLAVLFVCLGNICRSPTAHGVLLKKLERAGLAGLVRVDSAGTGDWHIGKAPDARTQAAASRAGYDLSQLRARVVCAEDFQRFDYILAMDQDNLRQLQAMRPAQFRGILELFLRQGGVDTGEVPDPYYGGPEGFEQVLSLVEQACDGLVRQLQERLR